MRSTLLDARIEVLTRFRDPCSAFKRYAPHGGRTGGETSGPRRVVRDLPNPTTECHPEMASETLVVTVVPGDPPHGGDSFGALPFTQSSLDIAAASADTNHPGKSPSFPRARTHGFPSPSRQRSVRSDSHQSSLGAVSDENGWAGRGDDDDDDDDEEVDGATKQPRGRFTKNPKYAKLRKNVVFVLDYAIVQLFLFAVLLVALFLTDVVAFISAPDDVDKPVELVMFLTLIVFTIELIANCTCREAYVGSFYFYMDILGTFSIVADIPTLSKGWLPDGAEIGTTLRVSRAAKIGARVSKDGVRLVIFFRSIGAMRLLRPWSLFSHRKTTRGGEKQNGSGINARRVGSTGKIAQNLDESMSKSVAIVVLLTILAAPLLLWDDSDTIPKAYHSSLSAVSAGYSDDTSALFRNDVGDTVAAGYYDFFKSRCGAFPPNSFRRSRLRILVPEGTITTRRDYYLSNPSYQSLIHITRD